MGSRFRISNSEGVGYAMERLKAALGEERLLEEIVQAMSSDELVEAMEYIARMWDVDLRNEGDDEDDEDDER